MVKKISQVEFESEIAEGVCIVDFFATWCGPCKMMAPVLEEISEELAGKIKFYKIDTDENEGLAARFRITGVPSLVIFKDGKKEDMLVGLQPKANLLAEFQKYI